MQLLAKDKVFRTYAHGDLMLFELISGAFQFGYGIDATIIDDPEQVKDFPEDVQVKVRTWLEGGGVHAARQDKRARLIAEQSEKGMGLLDQLILQAGGPELRAEIMETVTSMLKKRGDLPEKAPAEVQKVDHGSLVVHEDGTKEFVPSDEEMAATIAAEAAADAAAAEESELVGVGAGPSEMTEEVNKRPKPKRKR